MPQTQENILKMIASVDDPVTVAAPVIDPLAPTIFHEPWWLEIATRGKYRVTEVTDDDGRVIGRLPYFLQSDLGITRGVMPPLTHFLGPAVIDGEGGADTRFLKQLEITRELVRKLPPASSYNIKCHRGIKDVIAFQREGFMTSVQFTHEVYPRATADVWKGMQHKRRSVITRARKHLSAVEISDPQVLINFMQRNLKSYGLTCSYDMEICRDLIQASFDRQCGRILATRDEKGNLAAAIFCVWDHHSSYFLISARGPSTYRGSLTLLVWEAMQHAAERNLIFDMDGVSSDESVSFFSGFGATVVPRYIVTRETRLMRIARSVRHAFKKPNYYC